MKQNVTARRGEKRPEKRYKKSPSDTAQEGGILSIIERRKIGAIYQVQRTNGINRNWKNIGEPVLASDNIAGISLESAGDVNFYRIKKVR